MPILGTVASSLLKNIGERALFSSGYGSSGVSDVISYVTITTAGNSVSFGTLTLTPGGYLAGTGCASSTRGIHLQGQTNAGGLYNGIQYVHK